MFEQIRNVPHFYDHLETLPGAVELFLKVWKQYGDDYQILTGIPKPWRGIVTAEEDKHSWVRRLISPDVIVNVVLRKDKINWSGKGSRVPWSGTKVTTSRTLTSGRQRLCVGDKSGEKVIGLLQKRT